MMFHCIKACSRNSCHRIAFLCVEKIHQNTLLRMDKRATRLRHLCLLHWPPGYTVFFDHDREEAKLLQHHHCERAQTTSRRTAVLQQSWLLLSAKKLSQEDLLQVAAMKGMSKQESANSELPMQEDLVDKSLKIAACTKPS